MFLNPYLDRLSQGYLFPEIRRRCQQFTQENPHQRLISLSIGDTSQPLPPIICEAMSQCALNMQTKEGYSGYGPPKEQDILTQKIAERIYKSKVSPSSIFISDGSKCDLGRLQIALGPQSKVAIQNPAYPVYVDTSVMMGQTGDYDSLIKGYSHIKYLDCTADNDFFPNLDEIDDVDIIFFCHPNNPTGVAYTYEQLEKLVHMALKKHILIVFDTAYAQFIQSKEIPTTIYDIPGAEKVAIEIGSFSKCAGFTGLRLGWSVVPSTLFHPKLRGYYERVITTFFNGASKIIQAGGIACLEDKGWLALQDNIRYYQKNAQQLQKALDTLHITHFGGTHAPFIWMRIPGKRSWDMFDIFLKELQLVPTPGEGFGSCSPDFLRLSAFTSEENIQEACHRIKRLSSYL